MAGLYQELATLKPLMDEGTVSDPEGRAKKERVLARELNPGDLRPDLDLVQELVNAGAIGEEERATFRARLLCIEDADDRKPAGPLTGHAT